MNRIVALTLLCTATLTTGVVLATPSLATAFRSHHVRVKPAPWLWDSTVTRGKVTTAAPAAAPTPRRRRRRAAVATVPAPVVTAAAPPATSAPVSTSLPAPSPPASTGSPPSDPSAPRRNSPFTLRSVDARCFGARTPEPSGWPFAPTTAVHPLRGSFDEPRTPVHLGVDVEAPNDRARVYAMQAGTVEHIQPDHFDVVPTHGNKGAFLQYWHVKLASGVHAGTVVARNEQLGKVKPNMRHVHITEFAPGCGPINPARPRGPLADPYNTEWPTIGPLSAVAAGPRAFIPLNVATAPGTSEIVDPARPIALDALKGTVDLRASVTDMPKLRMQHNPQMPLAPAAIRAFLAPTDDGHRHLVMRTIFDGARMLPQGAPLWRYWAFGTYRQNGCYYTAAGTCGMQIVWHVGGRQGFDTTAVPNGDYKYCVEALTIAGVDAQRCTPVTIAN